MKIKALKYLISKNKKLFFKLFIRHPFLYSYRYLKSYLFSKTKKEKGAYLFGIPSLLEFKKLLKDKNNTLILGFSYCQKPLDCPVSRFSDLCNDKCEKCYISKYMNKKNIYCFPITTVNFLGEKIFDIIKSKPSNILFIITACNISIKMFKDLSNALNMKGIALPLRGNVCGNFDSFHLAEQGIKPHQTIFLKEYEDLIDELLKQRIKTDH
jgi:predicted transcriptional regulator